LKILLQTTIPFAEDDWHTGRFSLLTDELRNDGHDVTARNREPDANGDDPVLARLHSSDYEQLWLFAVDSGNGLSVNDAAGIIKFRERGGGVLTARDHQDLGSCLLQLGSLGDVNFFHSRHAEPDPERQTEDDRDNPNLSWPNWHSGANGEYQRIAIAGAPHEVLRSDKSPSGFIEWFPAHPHEGGVGAPGYLPAARVIATGRSSVSNRPFNLAVAIEGEHGAGGPMGHALAVSSFHHFADLNWDVDRGAPSFVTDKPAFQIKTDPARFEIFKDYVRNIAGWLKPVSG